MGLLARVNWRRGLIILLVSLVTLVVILFWGLPRWVVGRASDSSADVAFHFAIDPHSGADEYVAQLYREGRVRKIVCAGAQIACGVYPADYARQHLLELGVPAEDVLLLHMPQTACRAQLFEPVIGFVRQHGWRRILWVVVPAGSGQLQRVLEPKFRQAGIEFSLTYPAAARTELLTAWWRSHWKMQQMVRVPLDTGVDWFFSECR